MRLSFVYVFSGVLGNTSTLIAIFISYMKLLLARSLAIARFPDAESYGEMRDDDVYRDREAMCFHSTAPPS